MEARKWFGWSQRIYFLGFGFDPLNTERLGLHSVLSWLRKSGNPVPTVYATVLGRTATERERDRKRLLLDQGWQAVELNCSDILRNTPALFG